MYGNLNVDVNALKELSEPRADGLQLTEAEQFEAAGLIKDVYLPQSLSQEGGSAVFGGCDGSTGSTGARASAGAGGAFSALAREARLIGDRLSSDVLGQAPAI